MLEVSLKGQDELSDSVTVALVGDLDSETSMDFYDFIISKSLLQYYLIILDCTSLNSVSSTGLSILIRLKKKLAEKNSKLALTSLTGEIWDLFYVFGFNRSFYTFETLSECQKFFREEKKKRDSEKPVEKLATLPDVPVITESLISEHEVKLDFKKPEEFKEKEVPRTSEPLPVHEETVKEIITVKEIKQEMVPEKSSVTYTSSDIKIEEIQTEPLEVVHLETTGVMKFSVPFIQKNTSQKEEKESTDIIESIMDPPYQPPRQEGKFVEVVIACKNCGTKIKVLQEGRQKCPVCGSKFHLRQSGSISTIEKIN